MRGFFHRQKSFCHSSHPGSQGPSLLDLAAQIVSSDPTIPVWVGSKLNKSPEEACPLFDCSVLSSPCCLKQLWSSAKICIISFSSLLSASRCAGNGSTTLASCLSLLLGISYPSIADLELVPEGCLRLCVSASILLLAVTIVRVFSSVVTRPRLIHNPSPSAKQVFSPKGGQNAYPVNDWLSDSLRWM